LAFNVDEREVGTDKCTGLAIRQPFVTWHDEPVDITATEAMQAVSESRLPSARDEAKQFLRALLESAPFDADDAKAAAKADGISLAGCGAPSETSK
jgi:hypothetical protein